MKNFWDYIYIYRRAVIWEILSAIIFAVVFFLYGINVRAVVYPAVLSAVLGIFFLLPGFAAYVKRHKILQNIRPESGLFSEEFPNASDRKEKDYQELLIGIEDAVRQKKAQSDAARRDMEDYYVTWVHQIKAPIAVMRILLQQEDTQKNRELSAELFRIEQYVEMALCYVRLGEGASDLMIREYRLDEIIRKAIRKYAGQFIRKKIRLIYHGTDICVITDEKWLLFIIEQLLSNAVKYTKEGSVTIEVDKNRKLSVADTGIGISPEDLPRIFEKGYTGYNGRVERKSTGLGLYLCRLAASRLGHKLTAESEPGKGSRFTIDLESYPFQPE